MNPEDYIIVNKKELEKIIRQAFIHGQGNQEKMEAGLERDETDDYTEFETLKIISNSKPLQPLLEEIFEESRRQHDWAGGHIYGEEETEDLTDWKYPNFEKFIKDKQI